MQTDDLILISVDDHVIEPPDLFDGHLPERFKERAPRIERGADGADFWTFGTTRIPNVALNAVAGGPRRSTASSRSRSTRSGRAASTCTSGSRT